jgi:hypothetical protein
MSWALSVDLRDRVVAVIEWDVLPPGGAPVRGQRFERVSLSGAGGDPWRRQALPAAIAERGASRPTPS